MSVYSMVAASLEDRVKMLQAQLGALLEQTAQNNELQARQQATINEVRERAHLNILGANQCIFCG